MAEDEEQIFDPNLKKKKKKKKTQFDLDAALGGAESKPATDSQNAEPQKETENNMDMTAVKQALPEEEKENVDEEFDLNQLKRKKKPPRSVKISDKPEVLGKEEAQVPKVKEGEYATTDDDYTYEQLLTRVFNIMREKNPDIDSGERKRFVMKPPQMARVGTKKTAFANFADICKLLKRQPKHLLQFLLAELGTSGSVDANNSLILKGRYQQKHIESVLRRYIKEYVTCHTCRSPDTVLERETRLFFLQCQNCGSRSSVASIKQGFQAITGKRAATRAKTA